DGMHSVRTYQSCKFGGERRIKTSVRKDRSPCDQKFNFSLPWRRGREIRLLAAQNRAIQPGKVIGA
ncbi:MAG: hypothetical protein ABI377_09250, partial [Devosia sp.]